MLVGVAWYTAETWAQVKAAAFDSERFEATFAEWETMATEAFAELKATGTNLVRFNVVPADLLAWCLAHNKRNDAAARAEFVSEQLRGAHESGP